MCGRCVLLTCAVACSVHAAKSILTGGLQALSCSHSCIFLDDDPPPPPLSLFHGSGAHRHSQRRHGDGGNSLQRSAQLLLHQLGRGHRLHRAVHHPHRGGHHRLTTPRRRLGAVTPPKEKNNIKQREYIYLLSVVWTKESVRSSV